MAGLDDGVCIPTCEECKLSCKIAVSRSKQYRGRKFYVCPKINGFVVWVDQVRMCKCGKGAYKIRCTTSTQEKEGKYFRCCPESKVGGYRGRGYFEWFEEKPFVPDGGESISLGDLRCRTGKGSEPYSTQGSCSGTVTRYPLDFIEGYLTASIYKSTDHAREFKEVLGLIKGLGIHK